MCVFVCLSVCSYTSEGIAQFHVKTMICVCTYIQHWCMLFLVFDFEFSEKLSDGIKKPIRYKVCNGSHARTEVCNEAITP